MREGYAFTPVFHSVHGGGGGILTEGMPHTAPGHTPPAVGTHPTGMHSCFQDIFYFA